MSAPGGTKVIPHLRLTWGGTIGSPEVDAWSNGIAFAVGPEAMSAEELELAVDTCGPVLKAWITSSNSQIGLPVLLEWVKAVWVKADGKNRDVNTAVFELNDTSARGALSPSPSWNQSYALTLRTDISRGRGHSGRIYPPVSGGNPEGTTPYLKGQFADLMAQQFATCLTALKAAIGAAQTPQNSRPAVPVVVSRVTDDGRPPILTPITHVVVDRVADVIHSRTAQVPRNESATFTVQ
jgi:hypothetical protein